MKKLSGQCCIVAGGLLLSLLLNVVLWSQVRVFYTDRLLAQISPIGPPARPLMTGETKDFTSTIMLYGDSRLAVWNPLPTPGVRLVNAAIGGTTTAQLRLRLPALLDEFRPDLLVLQAGINDLKLLGMKPELEPVLIGQASTNLMAMVRDARLHQAKVLLLLTWPPGSPEWRRRPFWNQRVAAAVVALNHQLSILTAASQDVCTVDLLAEAGVKPGPNDYRDALHFQPEVYQRLTPALQRRLQRICGQH